MQAETPYSRLALGAIEASAVPRLLGDHSAVALERIARGGGATRWFYVQGPEQLAALAAMLAPGSSLSFYFDDRIAAARLDADVIEDVLRVASEDGDAVVGRLTGDGIEIAVDFVASRSELEELTESLAPEESVFYGRFPGREDDSIHAVTVDLPDRDGTVRAHPH